jgi:hypothetical protein
LSCPFCGDEMAWLGKAVFTHAATAALEPVQCLLRSTYFPASKIDLWNARRVKIERLTAPKGGRHG